MRLHTRFCLLLAVVLTTAGCGGPKVRYDELTLVKAGGRITLDGQPLPQAVVLFEDEADGTFSYGLTDANGKYQLQLDSLTTGVKIGRKVVRVSTTKKIVGLNADEGAEGAEEPAGSTPGAAERVPDRYNRNSDLLVEVAPGQTNFDFDLNGAGG